MVGRAALSCALIVVVLGGPHIVRAHSGIVNAARAGAQVSPTDAGPFLGEWTLTLQGPNGPGIFGLRVDVEKEKVVAEISSEAMPKQAISDLSLVKKALVLGYSFMWEGNPVSAVVTLTPADDGKTAAQIDFAGGAYIMTGTATKKEKPKS
jgi:hypothetical protein